MNDLLIQLVDSHYKLIVTLQGVADHVTAIRKVLVSRFPEIEEELTAQIKTEMKNSREYVAAVNSTLAGMKEALSKLPN